MEWHLFSIGKPGLEYARLGTEDYCRRIGRWARVEMHPLKKGAREAESRQLLEKSQGMLRIALDERGLALTSRDWAEALQRWRLERGNAVKIAFLIGGADGHTSQLRSAVDVVWSLSSLTLQHELALLVLTEQLYRVHTLWEDSPYHRD